MILKHMLELNDVSIVQTLVNFDFRNQFLSCSVLYKRILGDNLRSHDFLCLKIRDLETFSETTFSKKIPSLIFLYDVLAIDYLDFFLDDQGLSITACCATSRTLGACLTN